jgi:heme exporter protein C
VQWWNTLHQGSSISLTAAPKMAMTMLAGILIMTAAAWCYTISVVLARVQAIIVERERGAGWLESLIDLGGQR